MIEVIPEKAGIQSARLWKCDVVVLDSRFRGNDRSFRGKDWCLRGSIVKDFFDERTRNLIENKGPLWKSREPSRKTIENK